MTGRAELPPEVEIARIVARLREEVGQLESDGEEQSGSRARSLRARREAQRFSAVTAERPYLSRPGRLGTLRGLALRPVKFLLRRLMRWYVEPLAADQRAFNAASLRVADELEARLVELERRAEQLER
jgi:hypothetical protein